MEREYIRLPKTKALPDSSKKRRELNDDFWINLVHYHLLKFYKEYNHEEFKTFINLEKKKLRKCIEDNIKDYIKSWLEKHDKQMFRQGLIIDLEPKVKYNQIGFYDIKFQHSDWVDNSNQKMRYYPFECKNLTNKKSSIDEYVFNSSKNDGGVYRYFNGKYAQEQSFGGMLGFVLEGKVSIAKNRVIDMLNTTFAKVSNGALINNGIHLDSIENNDFTFNSFHKRQEAVFRLQHILFELQ